MNGQGCVVCRVGRLLQLLRGCPHIMQGWTSWNCNKRPDFGKNSSFGIKGRPNHEVVIKILGLLLLKHRDYLKI